MKQKMNNAKRACRRVAGAGDHWKPYETPTSVFSKANEEFGFTLDAAASAENTKCAAFFDLKADGLISPWGTHRVWCNPPFERGQVGKWAEKAAKETRLGTCPLAVLLIPASIDTKWFHTFVAPFAEIRFVQGRLRFGDFAKPFPQPMLLCIFKKDAKLTPVFVPHGTKAFAKPLHN